MNALRLICGARAALAFADPGFVTLIAILPLGSISLVIWKGRTIEFAPKHQPM